MSAMILIITIKMRNGYDANSSLHHPYDHY